MKTVIYLDVLLLVNFVVGYLLIRAAGFACGRCPPFGRNLLGGCAAALTTLVLFLPPLPGALQLLLQLAGAAAVVRAAFPWPGRRCFLRLLGWYFGLNMGLAGLLLLGLQKGLLPGAATNNLAFYLAVSPGLLFSACAVVYLAVRLAALLRPPPGEETAQACIHFPEKELVLRTLRDTGFSAREPATARPVLLVSLPAVERLLPAPAAGYLSDWFAGRAAQPPPGYPLCLVPLQTAAGPLLAPAFRLPATLGGRSLGRLPVAFTPCSLGGDWQALAGPELFDDGRN